jgi:choline dehydrogenase-like flavoprotein
VLIAGIRLARRIARAAALKPRAGEELGPGRQARRDAELAAWISAKTQTFYHPVGTCALGDGELAVVDRQLRVHGLDALRVIDASVMPRIVRGHTQAATVAIAERAAELIRRRPRAALERPRGTRCELAMTRTTTTQDQTGMRTGVPEDPLDAVLRARAAPRTWRGEDVRGTGARWEF